MLHDPLDRLFQEVPNLEKERFFASTLTRLLQAMPEAFTVPLKVFNSKEHIQTLIYLRNTTFGQPIYALLSAFRAHMQKRIDAGDYDDLSARRSFHFLMRCATQLTNYRRRKLKLYGHPRAR